MGYLNLLHYLQDFKVDRIGLTDFNEVWDKTGGCTTAIYPSPPNSIHENILVISNLSQGDVVSQVLKQPLTNPMRLDDRTHIHLHIKSNIALEEGDISFHFSDSPNLNILTESVPIPAMKEGVIENILAEIPNPNALNSVRSIGFTSNVDGVELTLYLCEATNDEYIITVEQLEAFEVSGVNFVLSKIDENILPENEPRLQEAAFMAGAAYAWMWRYEHETYVWDYGDKLATKNYAIRLLVEAEKNCKEYLTGGVGGDPTKFKRIRLKGGSARFPYTRRTE